jgi:hypothetical protein
MRNVVNPSFIASSFIASRPAVVAISGLVISGLAALAVAGLVASPPPAQAETPPAQAETRISQAETKVFFVENQPDGYGIDQCLASGAKCGKPMASAYCRSRQYGEAVSYRKAAPVEMPKEACTANGCIDFVAIECQR